MKATVLLISTYPELTTLARRYARHLNVPVEIYEGGISYGGHLYAKRREKDFEVFLSHGGNRRCHPADAQKAGRGGQNTHL